MNTNKTFEFAYKHYVYEDTYYTSCKLEAANTKEAFIKFVAQCNAETYEVTLDWLTKKLGENWTIKNAMNRLNPLGNSHLGLYRLDEIKKLTRKESTKKEYNEAELMVFLSGQIQTK